MHCIAFTCKEWKPNSLGRYGKNSSASKTCFVAAMFAHMLRLIIQNRFHLLLKYFSIRNSLSDVPSAPLFVDAVSIFVACAVEFQIGVLVFAVLFAWEMAWDSSIVNIVLQTMKRQLFMNTLVIDGKSKSLSVECCLETNMRRDVN